MYHELWMPREEIAFTAQPKIQSQSRLCKEHCYRKKAASVGQNGRLSASNTRAMARASSARTHHYPVTFSFFDL